MTVAPLMLAVDVAAALTQSGVDATTRVTPDGLVELLLMLEPWTRTMAVLDVRDLSVALIDGDQYVEPRTAPGPLQPGVEVCCDPVCLSAATWLWVLRWRGTAV